MRQGEAHLLCFRRHETRQGRKITVKACKGAHFRLRLNAHEVWDFFALYLNLKSKPGPLFKRAARLLMNCRIPDSGEALTYEQNVFRKSSRLWRKKGMNFRPIKVFALN